MQQRFRRLAVFFGAVTLAGSGLVMVACGTDNGDTVATPQVEAGKDTGAKADTGSTTDPDGSTVVDAAAEADCKDNPKLRNNENGFYCTFKKFDAGAEGGANCGNGETCCNPSEKIGADFAPSFCATGKDDTACKAQAAANNSSFDAGSAWACADNAACNGGEVCCLIQDPARLPKTLNIGNTPANDAKHPQACGAKTAYNAGGTRCRTGPNCAAGEEKMCSLNDDTCGAGTKCTPFEGFFRDMGYCAPIK
jgi:hypothetical protein